MERGASSAGRQATSVDGDAATAQSALRAFKSMEQTKREIWHFGNRHRPDRGAVAAIAVLAVLGHKSGALNEFDMPTRKAGRHDP